MLILLEAAGGIEPPSMALQAIVAGCFVLCYCMFLINILFLFMNFGCIDTFKTTFEEILPVDLFKFNEITGCINWQGRLDFDGYGRFKIENSNKSELIHRIVFRTIHGNIPDSMMITHKCDNRKCCNPLHLALGDAISNNKERVDRGRSNNGERNGQSKLTEDEVIAIKRYSGTNVSIADFLGIASSQIRRIKNGEQWGFLYDDDRALPDYLENLLQNPVKKENISVRGVNNFCSKITSDEVIAIRRYKGPNHLIATYLDISTTHVGRIKRNIIWAYLTDDKRDLPHYLQSFLDNYKINLVKRQGSRLNKLNIDSIIAIKRHTGTATSIANFLGLTGKQVASIKKSNTWSNIIDDGRKLPNHLESFLKESKGKASSHLNNSGEKNKNAKLTDIKVIAIRRYTGTVASMARFLGISKNIAQTVKRGEYWKHVVDTGQTLPEYLQLFLDNPITVNRSSKQYPEHLR